MKRLNQNSTIATTAMQTKTNTMKNKMNLLFRYAFIVIFTFLGFLNLWGWSAVPVWNGSQWCSYYHQNEIKIGYVVGRTTIVESDIYMPCGNSITYYYMSGSNVGDYQTHCVNSYYDNNGDTQTETATVSQNKSRNKWSSSPHSFIVYSENTYHINIQRHGTSGSEELKIKEITLPLKNHIRLINGTNYGTTDAQTKDFGNVNVGSESEYIIPLRSFLTEGNLKYKIIGNAEGYLISIPTINSGAYTTPTPDAEVTILTEGNKCGYNGANPNAAGNPINTDNFIKVKFAPKTNDQRDATLIIYDGTNSVTVNLTGTGTLASKEFGSDASRIFLGQSSQPETITASTLGGFDNNYEIVAPNHFEVKTNGSWGTTATINNGWGGTYYVRFSPKDTNGGTKSGTVTLRNRNNHNETYNILSVTGYPNKEAFDFGEVTINTKSNSRQFVLSDYWKTLTNATLTVPEFFEISADNSNYGSSINMSAISQGSPFYVRFDAKEKAGDNINDKIGVVTVSYNQESIELIDIRGKRSRKTPTITWVSDKMLIYANEIHECLSTFIDAGKSDLGDGTITFSSNDIGKIGICDQSGNLINGGGGPGSYFMYMNTSGTVDITINTDQTSIYNAGTATQQFSITNLIKQEIVWDQQLELMKIKMGETQSPIRLKAYCVEQGTGNRTNVQVQYKSSNTSVVSVQGDLLTIVATGTAKLTAWASKTATYEKPLDVEFDVKVKAAGDNSCDAYALNPVPKISNTTEVHFKQDNGRYVPADKISFTYYVKGEDYELFNNGNDRTIKIRPILSDGATGEPILNEKGEGGTFGNWNGKIETNTINDYQLTENTIGLKFEGDYNDSYGNVSNLYVTQATYLRKAIQSFDFGDRISGRQYIEPITVATYSNLTDEVTATLVKRDGTAYTDGKFEIDETDTRNNLGSGCGDFGEIKIAVKYIPTGDNEQHTCTLRIVGKKGPDTEEPIIVELKGKAVKAAQTITWTQTFSGLDALSTQPVAGVHKAAIPLNATTDATDAAGNIETVSYKSSDPSIANVVNRKLEIYKAGTVNITAFHNGNDIYRKSDEAQGTKTITIAHAKPNFEFDPLDVPVSGDVYQTIVFETYTLNAKSEGTDGNGVSRQSNGQINYKVVAGNATVTLNNANLTFNTRGTAEGTDVWVEASLAETEVFAAETCTLKMKAQRTTPSIFEWDITPADVYYAQGKTKTFRAQKDPNNDGKIRYSVPNSDIIEIEDPYVGEYKVVKVGGPVTISAHLEEGTDYYAATTVLTQEVYVKSASPMLQFVGSVPQTIHYGDNTQQVLAESTSIPHSMGSISYEYVEVDGTDIATVTTVHNPENQKLYGKIEPKKQGKFKIKAIIQQETTFDRYAYEEIISDEIEVLAAEQNITWSSSQQTTINTLGTGAEVKLEATSSNKNNTTLPGNPVKFRIAENGTIARIEQRTDGWYLVSNGAGSGEVTVRAFADGSEQYEANDDEVNDKVFTINKVQQTIVWNYTDGKITIPATKLNNDTLINMPTLGYVTTKTMNYRFENVSSTFNYSIAGNNQLKLTLLSTAANTDRMYASIEGDENTIGVSDIPLEITINKITPVILWDNKPESNLTISTSAADKHILTGNAYLINTSTGKTIDNEKVSLEIENIGEICSTNGKIITNNERQDIDYNGQGSGKVKITAHFDGNEIYNPTENNPYFIVEVQKTQPTVSLGTPSNVHYGDKVRLNASVDPAGLNPDIKYTYSSEFGGLSFDNDNNVANVQEVGNGVTITARVEDCWYSESTGNCEAFDIAKSAQSIVWEQTDMNLPVVGASDVQLTAFAIDSRHNDQTQTCLELTNGKYITAKTEGDESVVASETNMTITYNVEELDDVCKPDGETRGIVEVNADGHLQVTGVGTGSVRITPTVSEGAHYASAIGTKSIIVIVNKVDPEITFNSNYINGGEAIYYSQKELQLSATSIYGSGDYTYTYTTASDNGAIGINGSTFKATHAGKVNITAVKATDCIAESKTETVNDVEILKANQVIVWNPSKTSLLTTDKTSDKGILLDATAHNELDNGEVSAQVAYTVITNEEGLADVAQIIEVDGHSYLVAKGTGAGSVKVLATASASDNFNEKTETKTFTVNKADADFFSIADITMTYNDAAISLNNDISEGTLTPGRDYQVSYTVGDNGNGYFAVDDENKTIRPLNANVNENGELVEMTLNANITGMTNYNDKLITGKVYVQRATQTIVWSDIQTSYDTWNAGAEKTVNLDDYTQSKDVSHGNAGITPDLTKTYELDISGKECDDIDNANVAYIDNYNVLHITGATSAILTIYAKQNGTDNNGENYTKVEKSNNCTTVITINKITPTISFDRSNVNDGEEVYYSDPITYTVSSTGTDYSVSDVSKFTFNVTPVDQGAISENVASHAGNVKIKASQAEDCMINGVVSGEVDVEIKKAPQHISWNVTDLGTLSATSTEGVELTAEAMNSRQSTPSGMTITYTVCDAQGNDITSDALITIGNDNKVYSAHNGSGDAWVKAVANGDDNYEASEVPVLRKITITEATPTIAWTDPCSGQMTMHYRDKKQLTFSCDYTGYTALYTLTDPSDDTYVDITELAKGNVKIIGVKPDNDTIGIKVTISDPIGNYSDGELTTAITTQKNNTEIDWNGQSFETYTTADTGTEIVLTAFVKDLYKNDYSGETVSYDFKGTDMVANCDNIVELTDDGKLKITGNAAGTVTLYASYAGDENYNASDETSMTITVGKQTPSFAWADGRDIQATYGETGKTAVATPDVTGTVTYSSSDPTVATIDEDGAITLLKQGETTIYADLAATCQYEGARISKRLTVGRKGRTLSWSTAPRDMIYGNTQTVAATVSEGEGTITYSINDNTHAAIDSLTGEITANGVTSDSITVTATIAQTEQYERASAIGKFIITPATAIFVWGDGWSSTDAREMDYQASETLSVVCQTDGYTGYNVTYSVANDDAQYVNIADDVVTVTEVKSLGNVIVTATISDNNGNYSNVDLTTKIRTNKIDVSDRKFIFSDVTLTYNKAGENLDEHISCAEPGMPFTISGYTISQSEGTTYVSLGSDNKTLNPVNATNGATVTVKAHITGMTNYNDCDVNGNVTVNKGTQTITWDESKDYNVSNMIGSIDLSGYCSGTSGGGTITFSSLDTTVAKVSGNDLVIKKITTGGTVTITATAEGTANYKEATESREFTITVETPIITVIGGGTESVPLDLSATEPKINSVTNNVDLAAKLVAEGVLTCNYQDVTYTFVSDNTDIATFNVTDNKTIISYKRSDALKLTVTAKVDENHQCSKELWVKIPRGTMVFNSTGTWSDKDRWSRTDILPLADHHNVSIQANCTISSAAVAECFDLTIENNGSLQVNADAVLNVAGTIANSVAANLRLKADASHSATVLFAGGSPDATVENYIQGGLSPEGEGENMKNNPDWQYRGFVGNGPSLSGWNVVIFKWNEALNSTNCWGESPVYEKTGSYSGSPWDGYCMANYDTGNPVRDYTSKLIPSDTTMTYNLSYTNHGQQYPNRGVNLITNSWSAPIDMSSTGVVFDGSVENTFYFYQTRNHNAWEADSASTFLVYPKNTGHVTASSNMIASGQSFLVRATGSNASLTINGGALAHQANGFMYAPAEKERFNVLSITMSVDTMADRVFLLESENCSRAFDNGYDGTKIKEGNMPQIFASNDFGHTAVNTDKTMLGQRIGYSAAEDGALCTITFNTDRLEGFSELYLYDRVARRYADILAGDSYSFTGTKAGEEERFEIVGRRDDGSEFVTSSDMMIEVIGNRALLSGFAGSNDAVFITDMNGKRLWTDKASNGPWFELPNLPAGVYLINCGEANCKFIVK